MKAYQKRSQESREKLLGTLRQAQSAAPIERSPFPEISDSHPIYPPAPSELVDLFLEKFESIQGHPIVARDAEDAQAKFRELRDLNPWNRIYIADDELKSMFSDVESVPSLEEDTEISVTRADYLIARTGSLIITSQLAAGRQGTVYAPVHLVVAYSDQILYDIEQGLDSVVRRDQLPSMINLNTGPSRTADIEKTLVVGIHGPKEVYLILIQK